MKKQDITDELIIREETSGYSFEKSKGNMDEDIKILENIIKKCKECNLNECVQCEYCYSDIQALEHILSDYKRVLKENEELKDKYAAFVKMSSEVIANSISVANLL